MNGWPQNTITIKASFVIVLFCSERQSSLASRVCVRERKENCRGVRRGWRVRWVWDYIIMRFSSSFTSQRTDTMCVSKRKRKEKINDILTQQFLLQLLLLLIVAVIMPHKDCHSLILWREEQMELIIKTFLIIERFIFVR